MFMCVRFCAVRPANLFSVSVVLSFCECYINGMKQFVTFQDTLTKNVLNLFLAILGLRCCSQVFSSCGEWRLLFVAVWRPLTAVASLVC